MPGEGPQGQERGDKGKSPHVPFYIYLAINPDIRPLRRHYTPMAPRKTSKTKAILLRAAEADYLSWQAEAEKAGITLTEFIRRRVNLRPLTARKRKYAELTAEREAQEATPEPSSTALSAPEDDEPVCEHGFSANELCRVCDAEEIAEDAKEHAREAAWQQRLADERQESERRNRRWKANGLAYEAGGAARWFSSMTPEQHAEWDDLRDDMLRCERNQ